MAIYEEWVVRVVPPRTTAVRAVAATSASANVELDNDIFQFTQGGAPQSYGPALMRVQNSDLTNNVFVLFGSTNGVTANSAATAGATVCCRIAPNSDAEFEINPSVDKFMAYVTPNGSANTATVRYWITTFPKSGTAFGA